MFVQMQFTDMHNEKSLLVPTEAIIQTGKRTVAMLAEEGGRFRPVGVEIGIESGGLTEVQRGLQLGQRVVVSSQFLIDSEASLKGVEARLNVEPPPTAANTAPRHTGTAKIEAIGRDTMTLSHGPIASLKWPAMTMDFKLPKGGAPRGLEAGDRIDFEFYMDAENLPQLTGTTLLQPEPKAPASAASGSKP
jgi:Cu(I)/Ag(I) efflux system membrane fusion protein